MNASGDKAQDSTRFWFDTRANLRREMEDRKGRFDERSEVHSKIATLLSKVTGGDTLFDGIHVFTGHADVPDDSMLRLVLLDPQQCFSKQNLRPPGVETVKEYVQQNGTKPRFKGNRLIFVAPDASTIGRLHESVRTALAWKSIVDDVAAHRLNIDRFQEDQAKKESQTAEAVALRATRDCFRWVLCPVMHAATDREVEVESFPLNTSGSSFAAEIDRVCVENELVISAWSQIHLRSRLQELYWKENRKAVRAMVVWEDMQKYLYLPRLKTRSVLEKAIVQGAGGKEFFGTAVGEDGDRYVGFKLADSFVQLDDTLLLIEPNAAAKFADMLRQEEEEQRKKNEGATGGDGDRDDDKGGESADDTGDVDTGGDDGGDNGKVVSAAKTRFFGAVEVNAATAKMKLVTIADEVISLLAGDPNASVKVTMEISAEYPNGAPDYIERGVSENANQLGFKSKDWE